LFFTDKACFQWNAYINSQNIRIWSAENPWALQWHPLHSLNLVFDAQCLKNERIVGTLLSKETVGGDIFSIIYDVCGIFQK
jgi:hypothetical protein